MTIEEAVQTAACVLPASLYAPVRQGATVRNLYAAQGVSRGIEIALALAAGVGAPTQALDAAVALTFDTERLGALAPSDCRGIAGAKPALPGRSSRSE